MKPIFGPFYFVILLCTFCVVKVCGQTVAIGHISAEVVESVSASAAAVTGFNLKSGKIDSGSVDYKLASSTPESVSLGKITINSGKDVACNLVIQAATLSDDKGNSFTIDPTMKTSGRGRKGRPVGTQTIQIQGKARISSGQPSGLYQGTYSVVFAYN
jgi:hypothetical protein